MKERKKKRQKKGRFIVMLSPFSPFFFEEADADDDDDGRGRREYSWVVIQTTN